MAMAQFFRIEMLPAGYGDCLWVEYGDETKTYRILIDGGLAPTYRPLKKKLLALPEAERQFELVVCTHIDRDHISGLLSLMRRPTAGLKVGDIWFNGWEQIEAYRGVLGPLDGEKLAKFIEGYGLPHNKTRPFEGEAIVIPDTGALPEVSLAGGMTLTLLSPTRQRLARLAKEWKEIIEDEKKLTAGKAVSSVPLSRDRIGILGEHPDIQTLAELRMLEDTSAPNGSSIAFLLEFAGKKALFTGDAFPSDILEALKRLNSGSFRPVEVNAFKLSHHGGKPNTSPELLEYVSCPHYLISSNGVSHGHPSPETIARILTYAPNTHTRHLHFNYRTEFNKDWDSDALSKQHQYKPVYPADGTTGLTLNLL